VQSRSSAESTKHMHSLNGYIQVSICLVCQLTSHLFLSYEFLYKSDVSGKIGPDPKGVPQNASSFQTTNMVSIALLPWPHALASAKQLECGLPLQLEQFLCKRMVYRFVHHLAVNILKASAS
jgi:hypothetical protein